MQRFRKALVESFVAAITLGWIFAQAVLHFAYAFAAPVAQWAAPNEYPQGQPSTTTELCLRLALPELIQFMALVVVGYLLLRWLYFKPVNKSGVARTGVSSQSLDA